MAREIADGDHNPATNGVLYATGTYFLYSSPAVGDLDGDLYPEIVVGTQSIDGKVVAVKRTGQVVAGWPRPTGGQVSASPALADLDGDGRYEVIIASESDSVFIWRGNGTRYPGWPQPAVVNSAYGHTSSPVVADLDGNGQLDILFAANDGRVHAWNRQGQRLAGWTAVTFAPGYGEDYTQATPTVADVDGDGQLEVLLGAEDRKIYGWNHNGTELAGFPLTTGGEIRGAVSLFDVDGDGKMEAVVVGNDRQVAMWDLPGELRADRMPWPFFRHDSRNTGRYGADLVATGVPGPEPALDPAAAPPALAFLGAAPNPFAAATRLRFSVASPGGAEGRGVASDPGADLRCRRPHGGEPRRSPPRSGPARSALGWARNARVGGPERGLFRAARTGRHRTPGTHPQAPVTPQPESQRAGRGRGGSAVKGCVRATDCITTLSIPRVRC